jgi:hypothetical protein
MRRPLHLVRLMVWEYRDDMMTSISIHLMSHVY